MTQLTITATETVADVFRLLRDVLQQEDMIDEYFDICGEYCGTVQIKDYYLEDRFVVHIAETIPGTGMLDIDTCLKRTAALGPDMYAVIEHLPVPQIGLAKKHLTERAAALGIDVH